MNVSRYELLSFLSDLIEDEEEYNLFEEKTAHSYLKIIKQIVLDSAYQKDYQILGPNNDVGDA